MFNSAVSDCITELKLYVTNLSVSINATYATPDPLGLAINPATSAADRVLSDMPAGTTALFFTQ